MDNKQEIQLLGQERISKLLLKFSIPCVMGLLIGALYNIVDQIFIGNSELGYLGNAATGVSFPVICIANAFAWCIGDRHRTDRLFPAVRRLFLPSQELSPVSSQLSAQQNGSQGHLGKSKTE